MKKILLLILVASLTACSVRPFKHIYSYSTIQHYDPNTQARVRLFWEPRDIDDNSWTTYDNYITIIDNEKKVNYGFNPIRLPLGVANKSVTDSFIGIPETKYSKHCHSEKHCHIREFIIPADMKVLLGEIKHKSCGKSVIFQMCDIYWVKHSFVPVAGNDYEIVNIYHLYKIFDGKKEKIDFIYD